MEWGIAMYFRVLVCSVMMGICFVFANEDAMHQKQKEYYMLQGQLQELKNQELGFSHQKNKTGFFVGGGIGNIIFHNDKGMEYPILLGIRGGYQQFFGKSTAGIRAYIDINTAVYTRQETLKKQTFWFMLPSLMFDVIGDIMLDKQKKYGMSFFAGMGVGNLMHGIVAQDNGKMFNTWCVLFNVGVGVILDIRHRIEFQLKMPTLKMDIGNDFRFGSAYMVTYQYNF